MGTYLYELVCNYRTKCLVCCSVDFLKSGTRKCAPYPLQYLFERHVYTFADVCIINYLRNQMSIDYNSMVQGRTGSYPLPIVEPLKFVYVTSIECSVPKMVKFMISMNILEMRYCYFLQCLPPCTRPICGLYLWQLASARKHSWPSSSAMLFFEGWQEIKL